MGTYSYPLLLLLLPLFLLMDVNHAQMPGYLLLLFLSFSFSLVSLINIDGCVFLVHHVLGDVFLFLS